MKKPLLDLAQGSNALRFAIATFLEVIKESKLGNLAKELYSHAKIELWKLLGSEEWHAVVATVLQLATICVSPILKITDVSGSLITKKTMLDILMVSIFFFRRLWIKQNTMTSALFLLDGIVA